MISRFIIRFLVVGFLLVLQGVSESASGEILWSYYDANETSSPLAPQSPLWYKSYLGAANVVGIENDLNSGINAWQVRDDSSALENPTYLTFLSNDSSTQHAPDGWRLKANARVVDIYRDGPAMGLLTFFGNRRYAFALGLDASGQLLGEVLDATPTGGIKATTVSLAPAGSAATAYHEIALFALPQSQDISVLFDGEEVVRTSGLIASSEHPNTFEWGSVGVQDRGVMRFQNVTFELGPFPVPIEGDFNGDGVVDLADFTIWRNNLGAPEGSLINDPNSGPIGSAQYNTWKTNFGRSSSSQTLASQNVPEPASYVAFMFLFVAMLLKLGASKVPQKCCCEPGHRSQ